MKVSVIIPAYNEEDYISKCLESLFSQSVKPFEIIVVDNNSTDKTSEIAKEYGVRVVEEKKQGLIYARNRGFNEAKGDIIARTDADTVVPSNWVELISNRFEDKNLDALSGPAFFGTKLTSLILRLIVFKANKKIFGHNFLFGPNMSLRKSAWEKVKNDVCLDDDAVHEDYDLSIHLGKKGEIEYDSNLKVRASARRLIGNPSSQLVDYLIKWVDTIASHKKYRIIPRRKHDKDLD